MHALDSVQQISLKSHSKKFCTLADYALQDNVGHRCQLNVITHK